MAHFLFFELDNLILLRKNEEKENNGNLDFEIKRYFDFRNTNVYLNLKGFIFLIRRRILFGNFDILYRIEIA